MKNSRCGLRLETSRKRNAKGETSMKTVEERVAEALASWTATEEAMRITKRAMGDYTATTFSQWSPRLKRQIEKTFCELIEDAAKILDARAGRERAWARDVKLMADNTREGYLAEELARQIRALGEPKGESKS